MTTVTVELEDLKTLVFATGVIKTIEGALAQRKRDPFVQSHLDFTDAHNRLAAEMRNAERSAAGTLIQWDGELSRDEINFLSLFITYEDDPKLTQEYSKKLRGVALEFQVDQWSGMVMPWLTVTAHKKGFLDGLSAKGCIQVGQLASGVVWSGEDRPSLQPRTSHYAVRITDRGCKKLEQSNPTQV